MPNLIKPHEQFPALPLSDWAQTKETLHLLTQIIGKIRLTYHPKLNHWWHVTLYPSARGLTTGMIPYEERHFEILFDFIDHQLQIQTSDGDTRQFFIPGISVSEFYEKIMEAMRSLNMPVKIYAKPYLHPTSDIPFSQDTRHCTYDPEAVHRYWQILAWIAEIFQEFRGRFLGKSTPVQLYWHSFDLVVTRFSGKKAPPRTTGTKVDKEAYSHEVISFGFWPGDLKFQEPAFYSYTYPSPNGLTKAPLRPDIAFWGQTNGNDMALMRYEEFRQQPDPRQALLDFLESAYQAGALKAQWPVEDLAVIS